MNKEAIAKMDWPHLFNPNRIGVTYTKEIDLQSTRSSFVKDYDRILFSAPFRKLQNKTQVFPLTDEIFVHSRLTHSLETASVGRTLGREVGKAIAEKYAGNGDNVFRHFYDNELQHVISAACLAHDIGNPPFGHTGEKAISEFFRHVVPEKYPAIIQSLPEDALDELRHFEGNANGFRILTHNFNNAGGGEFKLTYSTLAALVKYPCRSVDGNDKSTGLISTKKYNSFLSEWPYWEQLAEGLKLRSVGKGNRVFSRHPFVYLVEAADDICYLIIDLEDAHRLGMISFENTYSHLTDLLEGFDAGQAASAERVLDRISSDEQKIAYLRALVVRLAVMECVKVFMQREEELLEGRLNKPLTGLFEHEVLKKWEALEEFSWKNIYSHPRVMEREMAGYRVLQGLLEEFTDGLMKPDSLRNRQLLSLIPYPYRNLEAPDDLYFNLRSILDFISAMTDQEAMRMYRLLKGIEV
jgi:dGTPase